jgi:hypothetical protein
VLAVLVVLAPMGVSGRAAAVEPVNPGGMGTPAVLGSALYGDPFQIFETGLDHRVVRWTVEGDVTTAREDLGGYVLGGVGATWHPLTQADPFVVVRGKDNAVWYREFVGASWSPWRSLGGQTTATPSVAISNAGLRIVLVRGTNGAVYQRIRNLSGGWRPWRNLGGQIIGGPAVGPEFGNSDASAFVRGINNWLYVSYRARGQSGGWGPWSRTIFGGLSQEPRISSSYGFIVGPGTTGYFLDRNGSVWSEDSGRAPLAGQYNSGLSGIFRSNTSDPPGDDVLFVGRGLDGRLYLRGELLT